MLFLLREPFSFKRKITTFEIKVLTVVNVVAIIKLTFKTKIKIVETKKRKECFYNENESSETSWSK